MARAGDVLVVNGFGNVERAVLGGSIVADCEANGFSAIVIDGAVRDKAEIGAQALPVYARATTPRSGTDVGGRGEVNTPIACGGIAVMPGDLVLADEEGVVVVPRRDAVAVAARARQVQERMGSIDGLGARLHEAKRGRVRGYPDIKATLEQMGCIESPMTWEDQLRER
jgi:regulator of RNase E activity RraA